MAIIKKYNKANGTTYVYESVSYWDKEKQQPRSKRKLIGKIDPETGEVVPTNGKGRKSGSVPLPSVDASSSPITCTVSNDDFNPNDYQILYEEARSALLEKEATIANMKSTIAKLSAEKQELITKLEQILHEYKH